MAGALENKERVKNYISSTGFPEDNQNQIYGLRSKTYPIMSYYSD